jgi:hypothetical protein
MSWMAWLSHDVGGFEPRSELVQCHWFVALPHPPGLRLGSWGFRETASQIYFHFLVFERSF